MATNTPITTDGETPENQVEGGQVNNTELTRREFIKNSVFTAIVAGTSLKLEKALEYLGPNEAKAGGNTPEELAKQEKAIIEANGGIINPTELKGHLTKLEVKNPDEVLKMYEGLDNLSKSIVGKYINVGLKSPKNERLGNGVANLIEGFNNKKIYEAFLKNPTWETAPEGTTAMKFALAYTGFTGAELIITKELLNEIKGLDKEVVRVRTGIANKRIEVAKQESTQAKQESAQAKQESADEKNKQALIKEVSDGVHEINRLSGNIKKGTTI